MHEIAIPTADGSCRAFELLPSTPAPWPAVLVFMDGIGIRPAMLAIGERLAAEGYYVLLPDLFYRSGPYEPQDPAALFGDPARRQAWWTRHAGPTTTAAVMRDVGAFLAHIAARRDVQPGPIGATGYCMGGRFAVCAAGTYPDRFRAVAAFHPGTMVTDAPDSAHVLAASITARVYVAAASDDATFPDEHKQRLAEALAHTPHTLETYPAKHGWVLADTPVHDAACTQRHWTALLDLLAQR